MPYGYGQAISKPRTLRSLIDTLAGHGDRQAVLAIKEEGAEHWSYGELAEHTRRVAHGLIGKGVGRGDNVVLLAANRPEWMIACLGVLGVGAAVTPVDAQLADGTLSRILGYSGARFVFTTADQAERLDHLDTEPAPKLILLDVGDDDERSWRHLLTEDEDWGAELASPEPDDPAALFYTSGTTGTPKGVPLSHANLAFQIEAIIEADVVSEDERLLLPLPLHHVYPFVMGMLTPLALGLTIVLPHSLTGPQLVRALNEGEVSLIVGVPRLYEALHAGIEGRARSGGRTAAALFKASAGLSTWMRRRTGLDTGRSLMRPLRGRLGPRLRVLASGGAPLDSDLAQKLEGMGWRVVIGYGLTETSPLLTLKPPDGKKLGSVGPPVIGVDLRVDPSAVPHEEEPERPGEGPPTAKPDQEGEILARGPGVFSGYRDLPEESEKVFTEEGWFRTKDLGYFDKDGFLYVTGRVSTLIVTEGGKNLQPEEVEEAYLKNPVVREIGVLQKDNRLVALIVPDLGEIRRRGAMIEPAIRQAVEEESKRVPSYQRISDYAITRQPLERTQLGKLRRHLLEERFDGAKKGEEGTGEAVGPLPVEKMSEEDRALLENPAARGVWELLAERYPDQRLTPDTSPQLDLGVDSLGWVDLTLQIGETTSVDLSEEAISRIDSIRDLLREVAGQTEVGRAATRVSPLERPEEMLSDRQKRWLEPLGSLASAAARGMFTLNAAIAGSVFGLHVEGIAHLPKEGPFVLTPNHLSYLDAFVLAAALDYRRLRQTYWAGWRGAAFGNPLTRLVSRLAQAVPIDPHHAVFSNLAFGAAVLERQKNLVWFPEGQRSPSGQLQPFKPGIGMLLERFRVPVVPVTIRGTREAMPPGRALPRPAKVAVTFGHPLDVDQLQRQGKGEQSQDRIVQALYEHLAELLNNRS